jgi:hypothetical protein
LYPRGHPLVGGKNRVSIRYIIADSVPRYGIPSNNNYIYIKNNNNNDINNENNNSNNNNKVKQVFPD